MEIHIASGDEINSIYRILAHHTAILHELLQAQHADDPAKLAKITERLRVSAEALRAGTKAAA